MKFQLGRVIMSKVAEYYILITFLSSTVIRLAMELISSGLSQSKLLNHFFLFFVFHSSWQPADSGWDDIVIYGHVSNKL